MEKWLLTHWRLCSFALNPRVSPRNVVQFSCLVVAFWGLVPVSLISIFQVFFTGTMTVIYLQGYSTALQWRHNERDGLSNHQPHDYLLNRLFRRRSEKTSKLRVTSLCVGNSQRASNAENVSIWWRHHRRWGNYGCSSVIEATLKGTGQCVEKMKRLSPSMISSFLLTVYSKQSNCKF